MNCIVEKCPEQKGCMFLECKTACKDPEHREEWESTEVRCNQAHDCDNREIYCGALKPHWPQQINEDDTPCVYPRPCNYRKTHTGRKPYTVRCVRVEE